MPHTPVSLPVDIITLMISFWEICTRMLDCLLSTQMGRGPITRAGRFPHAPRSPMNYALEKHRALLHSCEFHVSLSGGSIVLIVQHGLAANIPALGPQLGS